MADLKIYPSRLSGEVEVPPSKSMAHRAIICASLTDGNSVINNIDYSDDILATIDGMKALGAKIIKKDDSLEIEGIYSESAEAEDFRVIDCNESGSTLRFLVPISLLIKGKSRFVGRGNLGKRPLVTYYEIFDKQSIEYSYEENNLNLEVNGTLKGGEFYVKGNISSQFITGLLFTLPLLKEDSKIIITTEMESKGYIDLTLSALKEFGITIINNDYKEFIIKGGQRYISRNYRVEGDYSQAAFFLCADALGNDVSVKDLSLDSLQGDKEVIDILERMNVEFINSENGMKGKINGELLSTIIDGSQCPDIIPVLAAAASLAQGKTEIINAGRLRIKECDRLTAVKSELSKLGAKIEEKEDGLVIYGVDKLQGGVEVWSHKDHRIAMTLAIAATRCNEPIIIKDYECIAKSYPKFFEDYKALGGKVDEWNVGE